MVSFCVLGVGCRLACRSRRARGETCICGRHSADTPVVTAAWSVRSEIANRSARFRVAEKRVRALQDRYVQGRLSMEQYEVELDKVVGLA
jgi:hypothetical protein